MVGAIEAVLAALNDAGVRYLVVGGVAVVLHGHLRTTADLDLVVKLTPENALRTVQALAGLGYRPRAPVPLEQFADPAIRAAWARDKGLTVFGLWSDQYPGLEVDLFVDEPFDFDATHGRASVVSLDHTTATVVSLDLTEDDGGFSRGFAGHRQAQARMGLRLTPAQRLRWLETTMETLRRWRGRARAPQASGTPDVKKV